MRRIFPALAFAATASAALGQAPARSDAPKERFEFRGVHLGDTLTEKLERELKLHCFESLGDRECMISMDHVAGVSLTTLFTTVDRRVSTVQFFFDGTDFSTLLEGLSARWGKPTLRTEEVQSGVGARFPNVIAQWQLADGPFELAQIGGRKITQGESVASHDSLVAIKAQRRNAATAEAAKSDFGKKPPQ